MSQGSDQQGFLQGYLTFAYPLLDTIIWNRSIVQQPNPLCSPLILQALRLSPIPKVKYSHLKHIFVCLLFFLSFSYETLCFGSVEFFCHSYLNKTRSRQRENNTCKTKLSSIKKLSSMKYNIFFSTDQYVFQKSQ